MALTTNTQSSANGVSNLAVGQVVTDAGAAADTTFTCGFKPRYVKFVNLTDRIVDEYFEGMTASNSLHAVAAGTLTLETTNGITITANGFSVKAATILASKSFFWKAEA